MTSDSGIFLQVKPKRLRTLASKKKNGLFEKLSDPETAYRYVQKWGFLSFRTAPTSGITLTRTLASGIFPLPEEMKRPQDRPLVLASCLLGTVYGTSQVLGSYTIHGRNRSLTTDWGIDRYHAIDNFLNDILQKLNKKKIVSFYESRRAQDYYRHSGSTKELLKLAYKIPARFFCLGTILFSIETLWHCLISVLGIKKRHQRRTRKLLTKAKEKQAK